MSTMITTRRAWRLLWVLQGQTAQGLRLAQIAKTLDCSATVALRLLEAAAHEGVVERIPDQIERWRLTPKLAQIAYAHDHELQRLKGRLDELNNRYTRTPD